MNNDKNIVVILAGGGVFGSRQVGAIKALNANNFNIKGVYGCSIGALNGAVLVQNNCDYKSIEELWLNIKRKDIIRPWFWLWGFLQVIWHSSFLNYKTFRKFIKQHTDQTKIQNSETKFGVVTTNILSGKEEFFNQDSLDITSGVIASANLPLLWKAIEIKGVPYWDGATVNSTPVEYAMKQNPDCDKFLLITAGAIDTEIEEFDRNMGKHLLRALEIMRNDNAIEIPDTPKLAISIDAKKLFNHPLDFNPTKFKEAIEEGYETTLELLKTKGWI